MEREGPRRLRPARAPDLLARRARRATAAPHRLPGRRPRARRRLPRRRAGRRRARQRRPGDAAPVPPALLRRVHPRPGRQQRRSRLPHAAMTITRGFAAPARTRATGSRPASTSSAASPCSRAGPTPRHAARRVDVPDHRRGRRRSARWTWEEFQALPQRDAHRRHPLRDDVVASSTPSWDGRVRRHAARRRRARSAATSPRSATAATRPTCRSRTSPAARRGSSTSYDGDAARARARRPRAPARPAPVLLEEREVGARAASSRRTTSRASGRRSATTTAEIPGLSSVIRATDWRAATVAAIAPETPRAATLTLDVPGWNGHRAGQHVDVRLTAEDGYRAQRCYSIASAPEDGQPHDHGRGARRRRGLALDGRGRRARATSSRSAARSAAGSCGTRRDRSRSC